MSEFKVRTNPRLSEPSFEQPGTGLLLVTANEQSTAPGNARVSLTTGTLRTSHWTVISHR